jgi:hypothetical protein
MALLGRERVPGMRQRELIGDVIERGSKLVHALPNRHRQVVVGRPHPGDPDDRSSSPISFKLQRQEIASQERVYGLLYRAKMRLRPVESRYGAGERIR